MIFSIVRCPTGMFSKTGLEPCSLCPRGQYQPSTGKKDCVACPAPKTTHGLGTSQKAECSCMKIYYIVSISILYSKFITSIKKLLKNLNLSL